MILIVKVNLFWKRKVANLSNKQLMSERKLNLFWKRKVANLSNKQLISERKCKKNFVNNNLLNFAVL